MEKQKNADKGREGVKNPGNFADVLYQPDPPRWDKNMHVPEPHSQGGSCRINETKLLVILLYVEKY